MNLVYEALQESYSMVEDAYRVYNTETESYPATNAQFVTLLNTIAAEMREAQE